MKNRKSAFSRMLLLFLISTPLFASSSDTEPSQGSAAENEVGEPGKSISVKDLDTHYFSYGEEDEAKPAIIFIHGWAGTGMEGVLIGERLCEDYRFFAPDFPGLGRSDPLPEYSMDSAVDWLKNFAEAVGAGKFFLVGHSLGGHIAIRYALKYPETLEKLTLISPYGFPKEEGELYAAFSKSDIIINIGMLFMSPFTYSSGVILNLPDWRMFEREINEYGVKSVCSPKGKSSLAQITYKILGTQTVERDLGDMKVPVLLIWGKNDRVLNFSWSQSFLEGLPEGTEFLALENCGHTPMLEYPEKVASRILDFFGK